MAPTRVNNNIRRYSIHQVQALLNVVLLLDHGYKISKLAGMQAEDITARVYALKSDEARQKKTINKLIWAMFSYDVEEFELQLDHATIAWGIDIAIENVIIPFLEKVNLLSYNDTSVETHFAVTDVRRKLILGIEKTRIEKNNGRSALLYLPEGEHFDLLLLYMSYRLKKAGIKVYYLGTNISLHNLEIVLQTKSPHYLYSYVAVKKNFPLHTYCHLLRSRFPHMALFVAYPTKEHIDTSADKQHIKYCRFSNVCSLIS